MIRMGRGTPRVTKTDYRRQETHHAHYPNFLQRHGNNIPNTTPFYTISLPFILLPTNIHSLPTFLLVPLEQNNKNITNNKIISLVSLPAVLSSSSTNHTFRHINTPRYFRLGSLATSCTKRSSGTFNYPFSGGEPRQLYTNLWFLGIRRYPGTRR